MGTSIIVTRSKTPESHYTFSCTGSLFSPDFAILAETLETLMRKENIKAVTFDFSEADFLRFKPNRLLGLCDYHQSKEISFSLVINQEQYEILGSVENLAGLTIQVRKTRKEAQEKEGAEEIPYSRLLEAIGDRAISVKYRMLGLQPIHLVKYVINPIFLISLVGFLLSLIVFYRTFFGLVLFVVSGILLLETSLILRLFHFYTSGSRGFVFIRHSILPLLRKVFGSLKG